MLINYKYEGLSPKESDIYTKTNTLVEVDRSWYYLYNCKVTLSLKKSDMIKSDRFWHRINKIKTVAGLRRSLYCDFLPLFYYCKLIEWHAWLMVGFLWQGRKCTNSNYADACAEQSEAW